MALLKNVLKLQVSVLNQVVKRNKPVCAVSTTLPEAKVPKDFGKGLVKVVANVLNKPEDLVSVRLETDAKVWRGTGDEPTATVDIWSIGVFDEVKNEKYVPLFYQYFAKNLDIKEDRITLIFHPIEPYAAGHLTMARLRKENKV